MKSRTALNAVALMALLIPQSQAQDHGGEEDEATCVLTNLEHLQDGVGTLDKLRLWKFNNCVNDNCGGGNIGGTYEVVKQDDGTTDLEVTC